MPYDPKLLDAERRKSWAERVPPDVVIEERPVRKFNPDEPRDWHGRWSSGGEAGPGTTGETGTQHAGNSGAWDLQEKMGEGLPMKGVLSGTVSFDSEENRKFAKQEINARLTQQLLAQATTDPALAANLDYRVKDATEQAYFSMAIGSLNPYGYLSDAKLREQKYDLWLGEHAGMSTAWTWDQNIAWLKQNISPEQALEARWNADKRYSDHPGDQYPGAREMAAQGITSSLVSSWAGSSSDSNPVSIAMQMQVAEQFGLDQEGLLGLRAHAMDESSAMRIGGKVVQDNAWVLADAWRNENKPILESFCSHVYDETQRQLQAAGIEQVLVHRGMYWTSDAPLWAKPGNDGLDVPEARGTLNPLSSWSLDRQVAKRFAYEGFGGPGGIGLMVDTVVPRQHIFSFPRTGPGCLNEQEIVLLEPHPKMRFHWLKTR